MKAFRYFLAIPRTVYFNLRVLPFGQAIKLPIIVSHRTKFRSLEGNILLENSGFGKVKIGFGETQATEFWSERTVINLKSQWTIKGLCKVGAGTKLYIGAPLVVGDRFNITGRSTIVCKKGITFGSHNLLSWDVTVMDSDQHNIYGQNQEKINPDAAIHLGDDVWIGFGATVLKGVRLPNNTIIGAKSVVRGKHTQEGTVLAGNPAEIVKSDLNWD